MEGTINGVPFIKNLRRYIGNPWHLYINLVTLRKAKAIPGDDVDVVFEQKLSPPKPKFEMPNLLTEKLQRAGMAGRFEDITPGRQQAILKYLHQIKSDELRAFWVDQILERLAKGDLKFIIPFSKNHLSHLKR